MTLGRSRRPRIVAAAVGTPRSLRWEVAAGTLAVGVAVLIATGSQVAASVVAFTLVWVLMGQSWNIVSGMAGPLALGQAAFFGLTDLLSLLLHQEAGMNTYLAILVGLGASVVLAVVVGVATLRLPAFFFAIASLTIPLILAAIAQYRGYYEILRPTYTENTPSQFWWSGPFAYVLIGAVVVVLVAAFTAVISRRRLGRFFVAIRENQRAADASGVPTTRYKLYAFVLAAVVAGIAGALYAQLTFLFSPTDAFAPTVSVFALVVCLVGGAGTVFGPIIGGLIVGAADQLSLIYLHQAPGLDQIAYAVLLLVVAFWFPRGVYPTLASAVGRRGGRQQTGVTHATEGALAPVGEPGSVEPVHEAAASQGARQ